MSTRTTLQEMAEAVLFEQAADWSVLPDVVAYSSLVSAYGAGEQWRRAEDAPTAFGTHGGRWRCGDVKGGDVKRRSEACASLGISGMRWPCCRCASPAACA